MIPENQWLKQLNIAALWYLIAMLHLGAIWDLLLFKQNLTIIAQITYIQQAEIRGTNAILCHYSNF